MNQNLTDIFIDGLVAKSQAIPEKVIQQAKKCLLDYMGVVVGGARFILEHYPDFFKTLVIEKGDCSVFGTEYKTTESKAALLGEMRELGEDSLQEHISILRMVRSMGLDLVCLVGEEFRKAVEAEPDGGEVKCFGTSDELAAWLAGNPVSGATVLVKGSRGVQMEKTLKEL